MNLTFFLGNGFDRQCGLHTSYKEVLDSYFKTQYNEYSSILQKHAKGLNMTEYWRDFEVAIYTDSPNYQSAKELRECVKDFTRYLKDYLKNEEKNISSLLNKIDSGVIRAEMEKTIDSIKNSLIPNQRFIFDRANNEDNQIDFITLNYTNVIDTLISKSKATKNNHGGITVHSTISKYEIGDVIHAHGKINDGLVLGADNITQFSNRGVTLEHSDERALTKRTFITEFDNSNDRSANSILNRTDILCIFGATLGDSDLTWRDRIIDWFKSSEHNHIIKFYKAEEVVRPSDDSDWMDKEEQLRKEFANEIGLGDDEKLLKRIHIPFNLNAFNFKPIIDKANSIDPKNELIKKALIEGMKTK